MHDLLKCYHALGVQPGLSPKALKKAYRELVKKWHPDRFPNDPAQRKEAEERIKDINLAFERIHDHLENLVADASKRPSPPATRVQPRSTATRPWPKPPPNVPPKAKPPASASVGPPHPKSPKRPKPQSIPSREPLLVRIGLLLRPAKVALGVAGLLLVPVLITFLLEQWPRSVSHVPQSGRFESLTESEIDRDADLVAPAMTPATEVIPSSLSKSGASPSSRVALTSTAEVEPPPSRAIGIPALPTSSDASQSRARKGPSIVAEETRTSEGQSQHEPGALGMRYTPGAEKTAPLINESLRAKLTAQIKPALAPPPRFEETPDGQFQLASRYAGGVGVPQDYVKAAELYRLAAEAGHVEAQKNLGFLYAAGKGVPQDQSEAEKWFREAGSKGNVGASFAGALLALAKTNAIRAATLPDAASAPSSPPISGLRSPILQGLSQSKSLPIIQTGPEPAKELALKAPSEQYDTGLRHANGDGVKQDFTEAAKWYRLAAEAGHAAAQKNLGLLYASGKGVPQDYAEAEKWLREAAAHGVAGATLPKATNTPPNLKITGNSSAKEIQK
ncbi:MAG: SEL1-like repeat protein [Verrucomicrobia bacterium]|nr:SEL1-like repeat protein [Verrucomicrobiota bacterium]